MRRTSMSEELGSLWKRQFIEEMTVRRRKVASSAAACKEGGWFQGQQMQHVGLLDRVIQAAQDAAQVGQEPVADQTANVPIDANLAEHYRVLQKLTSDDHAAKPLAGSATQECKSVPDGFVLVPVEPTHEMIVKGGVADFECELAAHGRNEVVSRAEVASSVYRAMIAAAPSDVIAERKQ